MKATFNDLGYDELVAEREKLSDKLRSLRFDMVMGHVENPVEKRTLGRQVARINTIIHEMDTGIRNRQGQDNG